MTGQILSGIGEFEPDAVGWDAALKPVMLICR